MIAKFNIEKPPKFLRSLKKFAVRHPELRGDAFDAMKRLERNPYDPKLRLHPLHGDLEGLHAVSVTYKYRITLILRIEAATIYLVGIGSHDEVY